MIQDNRLHLTRLLQQIAKDPRVNSGLEMLGEKDRLDLLRPQ